MAPPILLLQNIFLTFGGTPLLEGANLSVGESERLCLVGRNGSGKSTLLKIAAGLLQPDSGRRFVQPGITVRYLPQEPDLSGHETILAYAESGLTAGDDRRRALMLLQSLGMTGAENPRNLSGGEARRAALACVLAPEPDILLLDEPTNHLDLPTIAWLETELAGLRSAIVLISHDRRFLETLSRSTVWLDRGITRELDRNFSAFESWRDEVLEQEERDRHKLDRKIVREDDWVRHGVSGRRKRNQGRLRKLAALRQERREQRHALGTVRMVAGGTAFSGKLVIEAEDISKSYGGRPIIKAFSTRVLRADRVGIVGANGTGKTTLLSLLTGALAPDSGRIKISSTAQMVSLDQQRSSLDPALTLSDALTGGRSDQVVIDGQARHVVSYMRDFLFTPEQARTPVGALSGGERGRLMLARALALPSNLLVLDEPTNDLDLETLDLLQEMLSDYAGTVLLVSHDRDFLDRVVTSVMVSDGAGTWTDYAGGYTDMLAQQGPGIAPKVAKTPKSAQRTSPGNPPKLTFKERHALQTLPARISELHASIGILQEQLNDPDLFQRNPQEFQNVSDSLTAEATELAETEERWLLLELRRQELEEE
jgi:ATP-binding cassette subfamily F protein uup